MISRIALIVFLLAYGVGYFVSASIFGVVAAVAAIVAGIAMIANS